MKEWTADQGNYCTPVQELLLNVMQFLRGKTTKTKERLNSLGNMRKAPGTLGTFLGERNCFCGGYGSSMQSNLVNYPCSRLSIQIHFPTDGSPIFTNTNVFSQLVLIKQICFYKLPRSLLNISVKKEYSIISFLVFNVLTTSLTLH